MIRAMIAEDERLAREELEYLLSQEEDIDLLPSAVNGQQLLNQVQQLQPDVVFLDIQMPEIQGDQAARMLTSRENAPLIVFTTAYEHFAVEAFQLGAVDYLLKPYDHHRLRQTMQRIKSKLTAESNPPSKIKKLLLEEEDRLVVVDPLSIVYAMREERVIQLYTEEKSFTSKLALHQLEDKFRGYPFFRTHRSYLVNLQYVQDLVPWFNGAYNLTLKDKKKTQVPVSRSAAKELLQLLDG